MILQALGVRLVPSGDGVSKILASTTTAGKSCRARGAGTQLIPALPAFVRGRKLTEAELIAAQESRCGSPVVVGAFVSQARGRELFAQIHRQLGF